MSEPTADDRTHLSAPALRTFMNIAERWDLNVSDRRAILGCHAQQLEEWSSIARAHGLLMLDAAVILRISAMLRLFVELKQIFRSPDQERDWLRHALNQRPFGGRAPLDLLRGTLEDQIAVRRYAERKRFGVEPPNEVDRNFQPEAGYRIISEGDAPQIQAVCFDGFGTLVEIGDKRRPFKALLGDAPSSETVAKVLTTPIRLEDLARQLAIDLDATRLAQLEADLNAECRSTQLRAGIDAVWEKLERLGLKVAVCSNLATQYGDALVGCLPKASDALVLSFEVGLMKPQAEIYRLVCRQLGLAPDQVLFVGDSLEADVHGPQAVGLFAMHIDAFESGLAKGGDPALPRAIAELLERVGGLRPQERRQLSYSPEQALDAALGSINAGTRLGYKRDELVRVLRAPAEVMQGDDPVLKLLLGAFFDATDEALLIRIAEGSEITWAGLSQAVQAGLQPGHPKRAWIVARANRSAASPP
ncbi:MAG TPA: HAD-IA family hydrolase [Ensifer sp.]|jgi:HAD superfamily hydrolase (TIGR01549 family)|uniref:HAD-IA family hydrolase n=1 Tax=Ensifer sp. TaxID=1872086 RepID=UPI002E161D13|nr:HAD-IA family hydrolase [Ensifer sp.]